MLVDEAFLRQAILNPSAHITQGYAPIMPTYQGQVSEEGLISLVEYIKNLNSNYRVQQTMNTSERVRSSLARLAQAQPRPPAHRESQSHEHHRESSRPGYGAGPQAQLI